LLIGVNEANEIFYRKSIDGKWEKLDGELKQVDIANGVIVGVNKKNEVWKK